jgi:spore cortex biosynthesis protein YabQ
LLAMIAMGSVFGAMLDTYQRFLKRGSRKRWIVFFNDVLFWFIQAILIFYVLFLVNSGELRFYLFLALLLGFSAYQALFKQGYVRLLEWAIRLVKSAIAIIKKLIHLLVYQPLRGLFLLLKSMLIFLATALLTVVKAVWKVIRWLLMAIFRPFVRMFEKMIPKKAKMFFVKLNHAVAGFFEHILNVIMKIKQFFQRKR